jgi:hypothetical protein
MVGSLHQIMAELIEALPRASEMVQANRVDSVPADMLDAILNAASTRAGKIEAYLDG